KNIAKRESLDIIDFYSVTYGKPKLYHDGLHPNIQGAALMAEYAVTRLKETLSVSNPYTVNKGTEGLLLIPTVKPGNEFVNWSDGTHIYSQKTLLYTQNKSVTFTATFKIKEKSYCYPIGSTESSRYLKKLWAEVNGNRVDLIGTATTDIVSHPGKLCIAGENIVAVKRGGSFTLKSVSNNPSPTSSVNPIRYTVILPFADWNGNLEFGGRDTNESLPMIGRAANSSQTDADAMAVVNLNKTFAVPTDAKLGKTHFRLNYTDGWSSDVGYGTTTGVTHTACSTIASGLSVEIILNIIEDGAKFSFASLAGVDGRVETNTLDGKYDAFKEITLKAIPLDDSHCFVNWTDGDGNIVSSKAEFTFKLTQDVIYKANFEKKSYPKLTHYYISSRQANRFINKAVYTVTGVTNTLFDLGTSFSVIPVNTEINGTAMVSYLNPEIILPYGTTSFPFTCFSTHGTIGELNNELGWCNQVVMIDWNKDFVFSSSEIYAPTTFPGSSISSHPFGLASGYSRTITVPSGQKSDIYRMYVMYGEPADINSLTWPAEMLKDGSVRHGNVYEFNINIGLPGGIENSNNNPIIVAYVFNNTLYLNNLENGSNIDIMDLSGRSIIRRKALSASECYELPAKGAYIINIQKDGQRSNFKVVY
ncbi:MAG: hypothetical protein RR015_03650, partial [Bacteroidales bacterium]